MNDTDIPCTRPVYRSAHLAGRNEVRRDRPGGWDLASGRPSLRPSMLLQAAIAIMVVAVITTVLLVDRMRGAVITREGNGKKGGRVDGARVSISITIDKPLAP